MLARLLVLFWLWPVAQTAPGTEPEVRQAPPPTPADSADPPPRFRWREESGDRRAEREKRFREYMAASPERRRELRLERWVGMLDRTYRLDEPQKQIVGAEVKRMQAEYNAALGPEKTAELEKLDEEMIRFWAKQNESPGEGRNRRPWEDPEFRRIRDRQRELRRDHPFDFEQATRRIEGLLPPEQAAAGRERREQMMRDWPGRGGPGGPGGPEGGGGGRRWGGPDGPRSDRRPWRDGDQPANDSGPMAGPPAQLRAPEAPRHPWQLYVEQFMRHHDLDPSQRAAAAAVLKDLLAREAAYRRSNKEAFADAQRIQSPGDRAARLKDLETPVDEMFNELKSRLDDLLTAEQRGLP